MTVLTAIPEDPHGYGRVIRKSPDSDEIRAIVEQKALTPEAANVREINSGLYAFATKPLFAHIDSLGTNNTQGEFYLTDMAAILGKAGERVVALQAEDADEVLGANTIEEMMALDGKLRLMTAHRLMAEGVTIFRPETTVIDAGVMVGSGHHYRALCATAGRDQGGEGMPDPVVLGTGGRYVGQPGAGSPRLHRDPVPGG